MHAGEAAQAADVCLEGLKQHPDDPGILCMAGRSLIALRRPDEDRPYIERARSLHPQFPPGHETFADLMLVEGQLKEAIKSYEQSARLNPEQTGLKV